MRGVTNRMRPPTLLEWLSEETPASPDAVCPRALENPEGVLEGALEGMPEEGDALEDIILPSAARKESFITRKLHAWNLEKTRRRAQSQSMHDLNSGGLRSRIESRTWDVMITGAISQFDPKPFFAYQIRVRPSYTKQYSAPHSTDECSSGTIWCGGVSYRQTLPAFC
jgi:hypothetical protein